MATFPQCLKKNFKTCYELSHSKLKYARGIGEVGYLGMDFFFFFFFGGGGLTFDHI